MSWISERTLSAAHDMWVAGMSSNMIAQRIGNGCTKNAIIGMSRRRGWPPREAIVVLSQDQKQKRSRKIVASRQANAYGMAQLVEALARSLPRKKPEQKAPERRELPTIPTSPHRTCQYPTSDSKPYTFCGEAVYPGRSYCEAHCRICYSPWPPARRDFAVAA